MGQAVTDIKNAFVNKGTSQTQRSLAALEPASVKIDDRSLQEFLLFTANFARQINYFNSDNIESGDWSIFWQADNSFIIAAIENTNPLPLREAFNTQLELPASGTQIQHLIHHIIAVLRQIETWNRSIKETSRFKNEIGRLVQANLGTLLPRLASYEKGAQSLEILEYPELDEQVYQFEVGKRFSSIWNLSDFQAIEADTSLFTPQFELDEETGDFIIPNLNNPQLRIETARERLEDLFTEAYNILFQIIQTAPVYFQQSLQRNDHTPHITLFLAFLELFQLFQNDLNQLPKRHLDFYYKDVLRLKTKAAIADQVHLFFELAKNIEEHELQKGVRFKAGKDSEGNELFYTLDQSTVFNKAKVADLRTVFIKDTNKLYAAPFANSSDGAGTPFPKSEINPSWATLGDESTPGATIGFAIASHELLLAEGVRTVTITFDGIADFPSTNFKVELSGEKGWIPVQNLSISGNKIKFSLDAAQPAVVPFNAEALKAELGTNLPVARILLPATATSYDQWKTRKINSIDLKVEVTGVSNLLAFNDLGPIDPTASFLPFGPVPKKDSSLYIGSKEAFQKSLDSVTLNLEWEGLPSNFGTYYRGYDDFPPANFTFSPRITKSNVVPHPALTPNSSNLFNNTVVFPEASNATVLKNAVQESELEDYGLTPDYGFIQISLQQNFGHDQFQRVMTRQMLAAAQYPIKIIGAYYLIGGTPTKATSTTNITDAEVIIPNPPYTPSIKSLTLNYISNSNSNEDTIQLIHIHPFENTYQVYDNPAGQKLVPTIEETGALFIGLEELEAEQSLSLLFQLSENTADAEAETATLKWYYLADNKWEEFEDFQIASDTTEGLIKSGIVNLAIPAEINKNNTILPNTLHWIKVAIQSGSPKAVSETLNVHAQAAKATFQNNQNAANHLATPLPAKKIAKLELGDASIKKIQQNYPSFGGRTAESSSDFYIRISERLRHKGRAITLYDYERLVLEAFPELYKVKCVNHSAKDFILQPGEVVLAVIPDFKNLEAVDRLQPKVTKSKLKAIREFLEQRNTVFVGGEGTETSLHILNPKYEPIEVKFDVKFKPYVTALGFHEEKLKQVITEFLAPWAFSSEAEINFGGSVYASDILNRIEEQEYVDHVINFTMTREGKNQNEKIIQAETPISIFVPSSSLDADSSNFNCLPNPKSKIDTIGLGYEKFETLALRP